MTKVIGLTGGIGSGKTYVAQFFKQKGIPVYVSDDEAKIILNRPEVITQVQKIFGTDVLCNGTIDRKKLATFVFKNPEQLQQLNNLIHPLVKMHFDQWMAQQQALYVIKESAILFESGAYKSCDYVITVEAPLETRIQRVLARDNTTREHIQDRINNQWTEEQRVSKSNFVIRNSEASNISDQIEAVLSHLR